MGRLQNWIGAIFFLGAFGFSQLAFSMGQPFHTAYASETFNGGGLGAGNLIDGNANDFYSSNSFPNSSNSRNANVAVWTSGFVSMTQVVLTARMETLPNGQKKALCFPVSYEIDVTDPTNSYWMNVGTYSVQPDVNGNAYVTLPAQFHTTGVRVTPQQLTQDNYGNYYFQMAEITWTNNSIPTLYSQTNSNFYTQYTLAEANQGVTVENTSAMWYGNLYNGTLPATYLGSEPAQGQNAFSLPMGNYVTSDGGAGYTVNTDDPHVQNSQAADQIIGTIPLYYFSPQPYPFSGSYNGLKFTMNLAIPYLARHQVNNAVPHGILYLWFQDNTTNRSFWYGANVFDMRGAPQNPIYLQYDPGTNAPNLVQDLSFRNDTYLTPLPGSALFTSTANPTSQYYGFTISTSQFTAAINAVNTLAKKNGNPAYSLNIQNYSLISVSFDTEVFRQVYQNANDNLNDAGVISILLHNMSLQQVQLP